MSLTGEETTLGIATLISSLTEGYVQGLKIVREENARAARLQMMQTREDRLASAEAERLSLAREKHEWAEEEHEERLAARKRKKRLDRLREKNLLGQIDKRKRDSSAIDHMAPDITKRLNDNFSEIKTASKSLNDFNRDFMVLEGQWQRMQEDTGARGTQKYLALENQYKTMRNTKNQMLDRMNNLNSQRNKLGMVDYLYNKSVDRGGTRRVHSLLMSSGYSRKMAQDFNVNLMRGLQANSGGDPSLLNKLTERMMRDNIPIETKQTISKYIKQQTEAFKRSDATKEVNYQQGDWEAEQERRAAVVDRAAQERIEQGEVAEAYTYMREDITPEEVRTDPEARKAFKTQKKRYETMLKPPTLTEYETIATRGLSQDRKRERDAAKKTKQRIKKSPYWSRFAEPSMVE